MYDWEHYRITLRKILNVFASTSIVVFCLFSGSSSQQLYVVINHTMKSQVNILFATLLIWYVFEGWVPRYPNWQQFFCRSSNRSLFFEIWCIGLDSIRCVNDICCCSTRLGSFIVYFIKFLLNLFIFFHNFDSVLGQLFLRCLEVDHVRAFAHVPWKVTCNFQKIGFLFHDHICIMIFPLLWVILIVG